MNCSQRILYNGANHVLAATLAPSSVLPSPKSVRAVPALREGSFDVAVTGSYAGDGDSLFEIEVVDTTVASPIMSRPAYAGVGTGELSALSYTGVAQEFSLELVDAGSESEYASVEFAGVKIVARAIGTAGNNISISVNDSGITYAATPYSFIATLPEGTRRSEAVGLDFGAVAMAEEDVFPAAAKRLVFGADRSQVYVQAKRWNGSKWEYVFEPELKRTISPGEKVFEVTGTYSATVTNGVAEPAITGIKTNFDFLNAVNTQSALVRIEGVIANDRKIGGQAAAEFALKTKAFALPVESSGSDFVREVVLADLTVGGAAPTELVELRCWAATSADHPNAHLGAELWEASGAVSGVVGNFKTGELIASPSGFWSMRIPSVYPDGYGISRGKFSVTEMNIVGTNPASPPQVCMRSMNLGPEAIDQTLKLVYTKRPTGACLCEDMIYPDLSNSGCLLGPNNPNAEGSGVAFPANIAARMVDLWDWFADLSQSLSADRAFYDAADGSYLTTMRAVVARMQKVALDISPTASFTAAIAEWDTALIDFKAYAEYQVADGPTFTVGETIAANRYIRVIGDRVFLARGNAGFSECDGFTSSALTNGASVNISAIKFDATDYFVSSGLTVGGLYVIDPANPGQLLSVAPTTSVAGFSAIAESTTLLRLRRREPTALNALAAAITSRLNARMDHVLAIAGIDPLGKSDASSISDDGCWRDTGDAYYWTVVGSARGAYKPAFTNVPYYSSRETNGSIKATYEFAFYIQCKCPEQLKVGDSIDLAIGDAAWPATYQVGDVIRVPIVAAAPLQLRGGQAGSPNQTWHVSGSVAGPLATFVAPNSAGSYASGGLGFTMSAGAIRFEKGDRYTFAAEGGHWRWRRDGGGWSSNLNIGTASVLLADGVSIAFSPGAAPSFKPLDRFHFVARQPNASKHVRSPSLDAWRWAGASAFIDIDFGAPRDFDSIAIVHALPSGATIQVQAGTTSGASNVLAPTALVWQRETLALLLPTALQARYLRVSVANATDGSIAWLFAGEAIAPERMAMFSAQHQYILDRAGGKNSSGQYLGRGRGGTVDWPVGALAESEFDELVSMLDYVKQNDDEPILFFYNASRADEAVFGRIDSDSISLPSEHSYQEATGVSRNFGAQLPIYPVVL